MAPVTPALADEFDSSPDISGLVIEDDTPVDSIFAEKQERLLTEPLYTSWHGPPRDENQPLRPFAVLANVGLFSSVKEPPVVPDIMLALDVKLKHDFSKKENRTYLVWKIGKVPDVVIEVVSNREGGELGDKLHRYRRLRIPFYVVFDPHHHLSSQSLKAFELRGDLYIPMERPWFDIAGLGLVEWDGEFEQSPATWLRWYTKGGRLVATGAELAAEVMQRATKEADRATKEAERATKEAERAARLAARLRELGIDPDAV